jgi:hypothetical protein
LFARGGLFARSGDFRDPREHGPARRRLSGRRWPTAGRSAIRGRTGRRLIQGKMSCCTHRDLAFLGKSLVEDRALRAANLCAHSSTFCIG